VRSDLLDNAWDISVGQTLTRREVQQRYGGAPFGGIEPSRSSPNVLLFTDPATGERHGYFDGWADDDCFHYTGEGQHGDQRFREGNKAIRDHATDGRSLRLFRANRSRVTYLGAFTPDSEQPYYATDASQSGSEEPRTVIVFRLRPAGEFLRRDAERMRFASAPPITEVPVETQHQQRYQVQPGEPTEAQRREASLVHRYRQHLGRNGLDIVRLAIRPDREEVVPRSVGFEGGVLPGASDMRRSEDRQVQGGGPRMQDSHTHVSADDTAGDPARGGWSRPAPLGCRRGWPAESTSTWPCSPRT
jgi:hypothetical protein